MSELNQTEKLGSERENTGRAQCPYLGLQNDASTIFLLPTKQHRCYATKQARPIKLEHQASFCLADKFATCPWFVGAANRVIPVVVPQPSAAPAMDVRRAVTANHPAQVAEVPRPRSDRPLARKKAVLTRSQAIVFGVLILLVALLFYLYQTQSWRGLGSSTGRPVAAGPTSEPVLNLPSAVPTSELPGTAGPSSTQPVTPPTATETPIPAASEILPPAPSLTMTQTNTPVPTSSSTPSSTPQPTYSPTSPAPPATASRLTTTAASTSGPAASTVPATASCIVTAPLGQWLYTGPGTVYRAFTRLPKQSTVRPRARTAQSDWVLVVIGNQTIGWIGASSITCSVPINSLPVL